MFALRPAVLAAALVTALSGCAYMAEVTAPGKTARASRTELAERADALFWRTFHNGDYEGIPRALEAVKGAYLNVRINAQGMEANSEVQAILARAEELNNATDAAEREVWDIVMGKIVK